MELNTFETCALPPVEWHSELRESCSNFTINNTHVLLRHVRLGEIHPFDNDRIQLDVAYVHSSLYMLVISSTIIIWISKRRFSYFNTNFYLLSDSHVIQKLAW